MIHRDSYENSSQSIADSAESRNPVRQRRRVLKELLDCRVKPDNDKDASLFSSFMVPLASGMVDCLVAPTSSDAPRIDR
jgi:hypothetical protein